MSEVPNESKRFDDWCCVDCNECSHYWDNSCDGVKKGSKRPCNSFLATRSVILPEKLKGVETACKWLRIWCVILSIIVWGLLVKIGVGMP